MLESATVAQTVAGKPRGAREEPLLSRSRARLAPFLAAALFVWLAFLVLSPLVYNEVSVFRPRWTSEPLFWLPGMLGTQALVGVMLAAYLAHLAWHRRLPGGSGLDWPIFAVLTAYGVATALSIYPRFSLEAVFLLGWVVLTFYVFHDIDELTPALLARGLALTGIAGAVYALYRVGADHADWLRLVSAVDGGISTGDLLPPSVPRVHDVGDHVNMIALAFNLTLPFALVSALGARRRLERALFGAGAVLVLLALFFTVSRAAWASAAVAVPVFVALYAWRERGLPRARLPSLRRSYVAAAALAATLVLLLGTAAVASRWDSRPEWLFRSSLSPRYDAVSVGWHIFRDEPWTGAGPNAFSLLYNVYSGDYPIEDFHPHNGYLAVADDAGLLGVAAVALLGAALLWTLVASYRRSAAAARALIAACIAALVAFAVHSAADMPNQSKTALLLVAVVAALSMKLDAAPRWRPGLFASTLPRILVLVSLPLLFGAWLWTDFGHAKYDGSLHLLGKGDFDGAASTALKAADRDPDFAAYQFHAGAMQAVDYLVKADKGDRQPALLDGAIASLRRGLEAEPRSGIGHANLALALKLRGDRQAAIDEARLALLRSPGDGTIAAVAGTVFEWAGVEDEAMFAYSRALTHDDTLIESPFWTSNAFRRDARIGVVDITFLSPCQKARTAAIYRGYPDDLRAAADACAREVAASDDVRRRSDLAVALASLGDNDAAERQARAAVNRAPDNPYARTSLAIALSANGDVEAVRHELMLGAHLGDPDAALLLYFTYAGAPADIQRNVHLPSRIEAPPDEVIDSLEGALGQSAPFAYDGGIQSYLLGILYYRPRFFRESPTTILIPGDWIALASPRTLFIQQALKNAGRR